jgi:hypothetical protein
MDAFHKSFLDNKQEYSIRFFDNKMDFIQMNSEQCVILGKDTYEIVKYEREIACEPEACETDTEACETDTCETDEEACETDTCETDTCETDEEAHDDSSTSEADESSKQESNSTLHITQERGC